MLTSSFVSACSEFVLRRARCLGRMLSYFVDVCLIDIRVIREINGGRQIVQNEAGWYASTAKTDLRDLKKTVCADFIPGNSNLRAREN